MLGLHVARVLSERGETVVAYSTSGAPPGAEVVLGEFAGRVNYVKGDIRDIPIALLLQFFERGSEPDSTSAACVEPT